MNNKFLFDVPKTLPVILLLDTSGSMNQNGKIETLNKAVNDMINTLKDMDSDVATVSLAIITFGPDVKLINKLDNIENIDNINLSAHGSTPLGGALINAKNIIEDKDNFPARSYRPMIICVSDGMPNDDFNEPLENFKTNGRSSKCHCLAMSIGADKGTHEFDVLSTFAGGDENVFFSKDAKDIHKFFRFVTTTVQTRTQSANPNKIPDYSIESLLDD